MIDFINEGYKGCLLNDSLHMRTKNGHEVKVNDYIVHHNTGDLLKVTDIRNDLLYYSDCFLSEDGTIYETNNGGMLTAQEVGKCLF